MTPERFKSIRIAAGLSVRELAALLRIKDRSTVWRWETGAREITGPASLLMEMLDDKMSGRVKADRTPKWLMEMMEKGVK